MVVEGEYYDGPCKLLELPHYVMRILFSYLDATALYNLSRTCNYLKEFILDPLFWRRIDARDDPNICDKIEYCTGRIHSRTTHLYLRGNLSLIDLPVNFFNTIQPFANLRVLVLENLKLKGSKVTLRDFPIGLEELSLKRTYVKNSEYFFQHSVKSMPKLRVLILDECSWVTCSFLLSVSKYEHLEIISIVKCLRVHLNMIPYLNVAKLGCRKLKIFDCRFTGIGGELLRTFYSKDNLQRLYFQSFKAAEVDYHEKILNYTDSSRKKQPPDPSFTDMDISDIHLCDYFTTIAKPRNEVEQIVDSILYHDPYPECTCGGEGGAKGNEIVSNITFSEEDIIHIPSGRGEPKFVCGKHMKDIVNLPKNFKDFFLSQQQQFNSALDINLDSDSNSDEEEEDGGCCYFGMGTSLIVPSTHDRTPSVGEEMSLPGEGASARNQSFPRVYVLNANRDNNRGDSRRINSSPPNTSRSHLERRNSLDSFAGSSSTKRRHENSDGDSDTEAEHSKRSKKAQTSSLDGLSSEAHEAMVNQLVESVDDVSARIQKIMEANGLTSRDLHRRGRTSTEEPSSSSGKNGTHISPSCSNTNDNQTTTSADSFLDNERINMPSCSRSEDIQSPNCSHSSSSSNNSNMETDRKVQISSNNNRNIRDDIRFQISSNNSNIRLLMNDSELSDEARDRRLELMVQYQVQDHNYFKVKKKIPLRRLSLRGYKKISDFTLNYIKNLDIELIDLTYTNVTQSGIENFLVHNPNCRVIHPLYCICKPKNPLF